MVFDKFKEYFHPSWHEKIRPFIESKECDQIYAFLKSESKRGKKITPSSTVTYRAFLETPFKDMKVVLLSYCPYHTVVNGVPVADGLAFSCSVTGKQQPSLQKFIEGVEEDVYNGMNLNYDQSLSDLTYLAKEGVLLLNSALTTEMNKPGKHQELWAPFTKYVLERCLAYTGVPIVFIGKDAQQYLKYVSPLTHGHIFKIEHPSFAARSQQKWQTDGVFSKVNRIVKENTNHTIRWLNESSVSDDEVPF